MSYKAIVAACKPAPPLNSGIETPDKANARFEAGLLLRLSANDPEYPAMLLTSYMFGGPITSHIPDRTRNREGLSYSAHARTAVPAEVTHLCSQAPSA